MPNAPPTPTPTPLCLLPAICLALTCAAIPRHAESLPSLERATKYNPMYESEATTGYSHYYRRYPDVPVYSSASAEASTDFSSEEMRHIYENSELTKEVGSASSFGRAPRFFNRWFATHLRVAELF